MRSARNTFRTDLTTSVFERQDLSKPLSGNYLDGVLVNKSFMPPMEPSMEVASYGR